MAGGIDNPSVLVGSKVICCCVQVHVNHIISCAVNTYLYLCESYWSQTLVSLLREICRYAASHLPLGVTSEEQYFSAIIPLSSWGHLFDGPKGRLYLWHSSGVGTESSTLLHL